MSNTPTHDPLADTLAMWIAGEFQHAVLNVSPLQFGPNTMAMADRAAAAVRAWLRAEGWRVVKLDHNRTIPLLHRHAPATELVLFTVTDELDLR